MTDISGYYLEHIEINRKELDKYIKRKKTSLHSHREDDLQIQNREKEEGIKSVEAKIIR